MMLFSTQPVLAQSVSSTRGCLLCGKMPFLTPHVFPGGAEASFAVTENGGVLFNRSLFIDKSIPPPPQSPGFFAEMCHQSAQLKK